MQRRYGDRFEFLAIYVREAHPTDGWRMASNDRAGISVKQPTSQNERTDVAKKCCSSLEITWPVLVDDLDDKVGHAYSGMPDRLYVIDADGKVAYKSGRGPFGFKPGELEQAMVMLLLEQAPAKAEPRVPVLGGEEAWKLLPPAEQGAGQALPIWARALAPSLPSTTAAMLELDYLQRAQNPLPAKLRGRMRWVAAHANQCAYSEAYAATDLRRAGLTDAEIAALKGDHSELPQADRMALEFARKMTVAANTVTDEEVTRLLKPFGEKQVVAMVLLLAYANFQDRLLLALDLPVEEGGPLPPLEFRFPRKPPQPALRPPAQTDSPVVGGKGASSALSADLPASEFATLQAAMEGQRARQARVSVPDWDDVKKGLPGWYNRDKPSRIRWSLVCLGHQPDLAVAWFACLRTFAQEAKQDRVLEESLFWVITQASQCYY
ncbi:MAG: deiodinase-like protein [Gemmataceae bacterium]